MSGRSIRHFAVACAVNCSVAFVPALPGGAALPAPARGELPVLWDGSVRSPAGTAVAGALVVAQARPPADALAPGMSPPVIARGVTGPDGRFVLRAAPSAVPAGFADRSGWVDVMVVATTATGISLAVDTVAWHDDRWVTDPAELFGGMPSPESAAFERPAALVLAPLDQASGSGRIPVDDGPGPSHAPRGDCYVPHGDGTRQRLPNEYAQVGEMHMEKGWAGSFKYSDTNSSSFEVGVSFDKGASWSSGGTHSFSKSASSGGTDLDNDQVVRFHRYFIDVVFWQYTWKCQHSLGEWVDVLTIEAKDWTGGQKIARQGGQIPGCNPDYVVNVPPKRNLTREAKSGTLYSNSFKVGGGGAFLGATKVVTAETAVEQTWVNTSKTSRKLCGESDYPANITRVRTL